jgi:hypothetical protein
MDKQFHKKQKDFVKIVQFFNSNKLRSLDFIKYKAKII